MIVRCLSAGFVLLAGILVAGTVKAGCVNFAGISICDSQPGNQPPTGYQFPNAQPPQNQPAQRQLPFFQGANGATSGQSTAPKEWCCHTPYVTTGFNSQVCQYYQADALKAVKLDAATNHIPGNITCFERVKP